jgi:hypothetical protein
LPLISIELNKLLKTVLFVGSCDFIGLTNRRFVPDDETHIICDSSGEKAIDRQLLDTAGNSL